MITLKHKKEKVKRAVFGNGKLLSRRKYPLALSGT